MEPYMACNQIGSAGVVQMAFPPHSIRSATACSRGDVHCLGTIDSQCMMPSTMCQSTGSETFANSDISGSDAPSYLDSLRLPLHHGISGQFHPFEVWPHWADISDENILACEQDKTDWCASSLPVMATSDTNVDCFWDSEPLDANAGEPVEDPTIDYPFRSSTDAEYSIAKFEADWHGHDLESDWWDPSTVQQYESTPEMTLSSSDLLFETKSSISTHLNEVNERVKEGNSVDLRDSFVGMTPMDVYESASEPEIKSFYPPLPDFDVALNFNHAGFNGLLDSYSQPCGNAYCSEPDLSSYTHQYPLQHRVLTQSNTVSDPRPEWPCASFASDDVKQAMRSNDLRDKTKDSFLVQGRKCGMSYKEIKEIGGFDEAESTLRGRYRTLTKSKERRLRKPRWTGNDVR